MSFGNETYKQIEADSWQFSESHLYGFMRAIDVYHLSEDNPKVVDNDLGVVYSRK